MIDPYGFTLTSTTYDTRYIFVPTRSIVIHVPQLVDTCTAVEHHIYDTMYQVRVTCIRSDDQYMAHLNLQQVTNPTGTRIVYEYVLVIPKSEIH